MCSLNMLLGVVTLALLVVAVESFVSDDNGYLSGPELTRLYNSPVFHAERMKRPLDGFSTWLGPFSHSGVRVTLEDGSQWLIHKVKEDERERELSYKTVVTDARYMSSSWTPVSSRDFDGTKTVSDFVSAGGPIYRLLWDNCHLASCRMMDQ